MSERCTRRERKIRSFTCLVLHCTFMWFVAGRILLNAVCKWGLLNSEVSVFCLRGNCSGNGNGRRDGNFLNLAVDPSVAVAVVFFFSFWVLLAYLASGATLEIPLPIAYSSRNLGHAAHGLERASEGRREGGKEWSFEL